MTRIAQLFFKKQEMFVKHVCAPKLKCHCDLDLWPRNPKVNRGHLLIMTNHLTKLEYPWDMSSLVIDRTSFVYGTTNRPKSQKWFYHSISFYIRTARLKTEYQSKLDWGHINKMLIKCYIRVPRSELIWVAALFANLIYSGNTWLIFL